MSLVGDGGVRSAIRRHQPPQRAVLSQIDCFVQCIVVGSQVSLDGVQPRGTGDALVVSSSSLEGEPSWHMDLALSKMLKWPFSLVIDVIP